MLLLPIMLAVARDIAEAVVDEVLWWRRVRDPEVLRRLNRWRDQQ